MFVSTYSTIRAFIYNVMKQDSNLHDYKQSKNFKFFAAANFAIHTFNFEQVVRIELTYPAWKAGALTIMLYLQI